MAGERALFFLAARLARRRICWKAPQPSSCACLQACLCLCCAAVHNFRAPPRSSGPHYCFATGFRSAMLSFVCNSSAAAIRAPRRCGRSGRGYQRNAGIAHGVRRICARRAAVSKPCDAQTGRHRGGEKTTVRLRWAPLKLHASSGQIPCRQTLSAAGSRTARCGACLRLDDGQKRFSIPAQQPGAE